MRKIVIFSGAGVSQESGISTYRDTDGIWTKFNPEDVVDINGWKRNPQLVLDFHNIARKEMSKAEPNESHKIIAELESKYEVTVITQNIDNLHEKAGSTNVIHLHGEIDKVRSLDTDEVVEWDTHTDITLEDNLRPHVVWFGEMPLRMDESIKAIKECDFLVIIGTSLSIGYTHALLMQNKLKNVWYVDPYPKNSSIRESRLFRKVRFIRKIASEGMLEIKNMLV